jgi:hypothetical protein
MSNNLSTRNSGFQWVDNLLDFPYEDPPGMFAVFFPQDVHRPNCSLNGKTKNRKVCMKVRIK